MKKNCRHKTTLPDFSHGGRYHRLKCQGCGKVFSVTIERKSMDSKGVIYTDVFHS